MKATLEITDYLFNPQLDFIKDDWGGNPVTQKNRFINHEFPFVNRFSRVMEWKTNEPSPKSLKKADQFRLETEYPHAFFNTKSDGIVWLGHASFLIRLNGITMIIDPVLSSPIFFMKRYVRFPFNKNLLRNIDLILLSHDHRDHLDKKSIKYIAKHNPSAQIFTGLNTKPLVSSWVKNEIVEAGWYQIYPKIKDIRICYLPTRHWGKRSLNDTNLRLWGAFHIECNGKSIYFGGDSGYGSHFREVKSLLGPADYAMVGIGAYKPEWFMHPSHTSPKDALQAAKDLSAKYFIPMHYGTFDLSDESIGDPIRTLRSYYSAKADDQPLLKDVTPGFFLNIEN